MVFITKKKNDNLENENLSSSLQFNSSNQKHQKSLKLKIHKNSDKKKLQKSCKLLILLKLHLVAARKATILIITDNHTPLTDLMVT